MSEDVNSVIAHLISGIIQLKDNCELKCYKDLAFSHFQLISDLKEILNGDNKKAFELKIVNEVN